MAGPRGGARPGRGGEITPQQSAVFTFIRTFREEFNEAPTVSFIARRLGISRQQVYNHLDALVRKGALRVASPSSPIDQAAATT